jgi:hypothetical protein
MRRNTPSGGLVGAAPLVVVRKSAIPPSAPQATPSGENLGGYLAQPLANMFPTHPQIWLYYSVNLNVQPVWDHRTASCSLPSVNVRPRCTCGLVCACWPWMISPLRTAPVPFGVDIFVPCCIHTDWKKNLMTRKKINSMSSPGACHLPPAARSRVLVISIPVPQLSLCVMLMLAGHDDQGTDQ